MKTNVYDSIRFHALHKRRDPAPAPVRWIFGAAAIAIVLAAYTGTPHAADDTKATAESRHQADRHG